MYYLIHEYTIYNTMYYPTSGCSDQVFNMMIGGHSVNSHTVLYASYPKVAECPQPPWGSWMSQCKCTHCNLCRLPWGSIPTVIQHLIWCWMSQCKSTHWGSIPTVIHYNRNTIDTKAILNQEHKIWRNTGKCIIGKILDQSNVLINKMTDTLISHECLSVFLPIMSKGRIIQWKISSVRSYYRLACIYISNDRSL